MPVARRYTMPISHMVAVYAQSTAQSTFRWMSRHLVDRYTTAMCTKRITYQIRVRGHIDGALAEWFAPLTVHNEPNGEAVLSGRIRDQAELFGLLLKLYNLNFTLLAVQSTPVNLPAG